MSPRSCSAYGNEDLQKGDQSPGVQLLQQDLAELGFSLVGTPDGIFGLHTEWAVRELQLYAKMDNIAQAVASNPVYADGLIQVPNTNKYSGPISGVVNDETCSLIQEWKANYLRCPVVIEAWNMAGGSRSSINAQNIWLHTDLTSTAPRIFARDFTNYFSFPPTQDSNDRIVIGEYIPFQAFNHVFGGPVSIAPRHTWPEAEILPENLVGAGLTALNSGQLSTFKVVRSVSEVECMGFFDCLNAYDNAFISQGPCHWTLGIVNQDGSVEKGELGGYLAYLQYAEPTAFHNAMKFFGAIVKTEWVDSNGVPDGSLLFDSQRRKYTNWLSQQQENGSFAQMAMTETAGNYFKTWHWFYRFVMSGRTNTGYQLRMWDMARIRLRDILATPWDPSAGIPDITLSDGSNRPANLGDVYTSECSVALLLRWHIRFPAHVISGGQAAAHLQKAYSVAGITGNPATWTDDEESRLIQGIQSEVAAINNTDLTDTMTQVLSWPTWVTGPNPRGYQLPASIGKLSQSRGSMAFDNTNLPVPAT